MFHIPYAFVAVAMESRTGDDYEPAAAVVARLLASPLPPPLLRAGYSWGTLCLNLTIARVYRKRPFSLFVL